MDDFEPVIPSFMKQTGRKSSGYLYSQMYTVVGVITDVLPPSNPLNRSKNQYEYVVAATGKNQSHLPLHCIAAEKFGANDDYEVYSLDINQKVQVQCILGNPDTGIIQSGIYNREEKYPEDLGKHWQFRFNKVTKKISDDESFSVEHDNGMKILLENNKLTLTDGNGVNVVVDQEESTITLEDGNGQTITIEDGKITLKSSDKVNLTVDGDINLKADGQVNIDGTMVNMNGSQGFAISAGPGGTYVADFITGIPIPFVPNVKLGGK